jgi:hypothetical protein
MFMADSIALSEVQAMIVAAVAPLQEEILKLRLALDESKRTIALLRSQLFGRKVEKSDVILNIEGQQLIDPAWLIAKNVTPAPGQPSESKADSETKETVKAKRPRDKRGLAQKYPSLPIQVVDAPIPEAIQQQVQIGDVVVQRGSEYVDELVVPNEKPFIRRTFVQDVISTKIDSKVLEIDPPDRIVVDGILADESIQDLMIRKFLDANPFHRTLAAWMRHGIDVSRKTVNDASNAWGDLFAPMSQAIIDEILTADFIHCDESWVRIQAPKMCARGNIWTMVGGGQVGFIFTENRNHNQLDQVIPKTYPGIIIHDAWQGFAKRDKQKHAGCNAHARRPFAAFIKIDPKNPDARIILELYKVVYALEHEAAQGPPEELLARRAKIRTEKTKGILEKIKSEADRISKAYGESHTLAVAARYIINHYVDLIAFLSNPRLPPDNNAAEAALRINALIRKNSMFFGSDAAAVRGAAAMTVLHSCKLVGLNPYEYLAHVTPALLRIRAGQSQDLRSLTPMTVAEQGILHIGE